MFVMQAGENATLTCIVRQVGSKLVSFNQTTNSSVFRFTFRTKNLLLKTFQKMLYVKQNFILCHNIFSVRGAETFLKNSLMYLSECEIWQRGHERH